MNLEVWSGCSTILGSYIFLNKNSVLKVQLRNATQNGLKKER